MRIASSTLLRLLTLYEAWRTRWILEALPSWQRKDIGYPDAGFWEGHGPRPVMRYPSGTAEPAGSSDPATSFADEPLLRRAG